MNDTHPAIERKWIEMLRAAGPTRRAQMATRLSRQCRWRAKRAIANRHPHLSETERDLLYLEVQHGRHLARRVLAYLK